MSDIVEQAPPTATQIVSFHVTEDAVRVELAKFKELSAETPEGYEEVRSAIAYCRTTRGAIETRRVELKADALAFGRRVDATAKQLTALLEEVEAPLKVKKQAIDDEKARVKREREEAERAAFEAQIRVEREAEEARLKAEREADEARLKVEREAEELRLREIREAEEARLREERRIEDERLAAERAELQAQQAQLEAERAKLAREREVEELRLKAERAAAELVERQARERADAVAKAERDAIAAERAQLAEDQRKLAAERAEVERVEAERQAVLRAEEAARAKAERERVAAEEAAIAEAERKARIEALRPDMEKLAAFAQAVLATPRPELKSREALRMLVTCVSGLCDACNPLIESEREQAAE